MQPGPYEQVPLTTDDRDMLYTIYDQRRRFLLLVYILLFVMVIILYLKGIDFGRIRINYRDLNPGSAIFDWILSNSLLGILFIGSGLFFIFTRILPFRRDIKSGIKEKIPFTVLRKQYFPLTDQYYLTLDDPKYEYHEIDGDMYTSLVEGGNVYLYRAKYSKYVFEENGRFTIL